MSGFDDLADAKEITKSAYLTNGKYTLMLKKLFRKQGPKGDNLISEFKIIAAEKTHDNEPNAVGSSASGVVKITFETAGLAKGVINACSPEGMPDDKTKWAAAAAKMCDEKTNPMKGVLLSCEAYPMVTKAGKNITAKTYRNLPGQTADSIKANRAGLDAAGE